MYLSEQGVFKRYIEFCLLTFLILNFLFNIIDRIRWLNLKGNSFAGKRLHKDLHLCSTNTIKLNHSKTIVSFLLALKRLAFVKSGTENGFEV